jgi:hypothetical protein
LPNSLDVFDLLKASSPTAVLVIVIFITVLRYLPLLRQTIADILPQSRQLARIKRAAEIIKAQNTIVQFARKQNIKLPEETDELMTDLIRQTLMPAIKLKSEARPTQTLSRLGNWTRFMFGSLGALSSVIGGSVGIDPTSLSKLTIGIWIGFGLKVLILMILGGATALLARVDSRMTAFIVGIADQR